MGGTIARDLDVFVLLTLIAHWLSLWLGFYLLSRRPRSTAITLAGFAYLALSAYLLCTAFLLMPLPDRVSVPLCTWLSAWISLAPLFLLHAFLRLTGRRLWRHRVSLGLLYAAALTITVLGFDDTLLYQSWAIGPHGEVWGRDFIALGPLYAVEVVQIVGTLALALWVVVRARLDRGEPSTAQPQLTQLTVGTALMLVGAAAMFGNAYVGSLVVESTLQPFLVLGALIVAIPLARYPGLLEGQLLRADLKSSLLGAAAVMVCFVALLAAAGASAEVIAALGWFVLAAFVFSNELRTLADRVFFKAGSRAGRTGLRTAAAYAGSAGALNLDTLAPEQYAELIGYLSEVDRAGLATERLEGPSDVRLILLGRDEFAVVRRGLGLRADWSPLDGVARDEVREHLAAQLEPRERQALGLKYLGYSDKEMARLMGVRPNVPRSYLSEGKRKLDLPAGAPLMLFVHFSGLVDDDAVPLLGAPAGQTGAVTLEAAAAAAPATAEEG